MKTRCNQCGREFVIPDERVRALARDATFPCPGCRGTVALRPAGQPAQSPEPDTLKDRILGALRDLPPMPEAAHRARAVLSDPDASFKRLAGIIETDPAISTRVLKIANSPFYGARGKIASIQQAAAVLGTSVLIDLLTLVCSSQILDRSLAGYGLEANEFWRHSLAVAFGARRIAERASPAEAQDAFMAGLLHDAGKIILDPHVRERQSQFAALLEPVPCPFTEAEQHVLGFDHATLAADACERWHLPASIAEAIRHHHDPRNGGLLSQVVHAADAIAMMSGIGGGVDALLYNADRESLDRLHLDDDAAFDLMTEMADYVDRTTGERRSVF